MRQFILITGYVLLFILFSVLAFWAFHLKDPHLLPYRPVESPALLLLAALGMALSLRLKQPGLKGLLLLPLIAAILLALYGEARFLYHRHVVLSAGGDTARALGSRFMVGYSHPEAIEPLVKKGLIGGVFLMQRNIRGKSVAEIQKEIADLQALRRKNHLPPLVVATDQEGGLVSRLSPPLPTQPPLADLTEKADSRAERIQAGLAYGRQQGKAMADLGFTVNFSPVVDLKIDHGPNPLDFHSQINRRAISDDPSVVGDIALGYSLGLQEAGITPTLKHFPGLGRVQTDTHHFSATLDAPQAALEESDWVPYRDVIDTTDAWIMLAHVVVPDIDPDTPASVSSRMVQRVLRQDWGFDGTLITDDLTMAAAYNRGLCGVTEKALNAGVDWLLLAWDADKYYDAMYCALKKAGH